MWSADALHPQEIGEVKLRQRKAKVELSHSTQNEYIKETLSPCSSVVSHALV